VGAVKTPPAVGTTVSSVDPAVPCTVGKPAETNSTESSSRHQQHSRVCKHVNIRATSLTFAVILAVALLLFRTLLAIDILVLIVVLTILLLPLHILVFVHITTLFPFFLLWLLLLPLLRPTQLHTPALTHALDVVRLMYTYRRRMLLCISVYW
jgi:hypothetical protein